MPVRCGMVALALAVHLVANPRPAAAQQARVSPFVPVGHWSIEAARRLHGMGLMPAGYDAEPGSQSLAELASAFDAAADRSPHAALYRARLGRELGALAEPAGGAGTRSSLGFGQSLEKGRLLAGLGYEPDSWSGPIPTDDRFAPAVHFRTIGAAPGVAWSVDARLEADAPGMREAYLTTAWGPAGVWIGLRRQSFETAPGAGVVLENLEPRPGLGLALLRPVLLPWVLERIGPVRFTTALVRARRNAGFAHPWVWATRLMVEPHDRVQLGVNRGIMFGGAGNQDMSLRSLAYLVIGKHAGGFDNQVVGVTLRYRPPVGALPLVAYLEWGLEDSAGAWRDVPGILAGIETPALPFAPATSFGVSGTWFAGSCCGNPIWYRNWAFRGGWADDGRPLGHSLGGHGRELRAYGRWDADPGAWLAAELYGRERGFENIYAPLRAGRSLGGRIRLGWFPVAGWETRLEASLEDGLASGWRESAFDASLRAIF